MRYKLAILIVLVLESAHAADKVAPPDFSSYPQTESFRYYLSFQTNVTLNLQHTNLLAISAFPSDDRFAIEYSITESGQEYDCRDVYDWAIQADQWKQLSETNLAALHSAIGELPAESVSPPIERLVIVSFRDGTNWVTRSYDSDSLPKPMRQIYEIVGERFESKQNR